MDDTSPALLECVDAASPDRLQQSTQELKRSERMFVTSAAATAQWSGDDTTAIGEPVNAHAPGTTRHNAVNAPCDVGERSSILHGLTSARPSTRTRWPNTPDDTALPTLDCKGAADKRWTAHTTRNRTPTMTSTYGQN